MDCNHAVAGFCRPRCRNCRFDFKFARWTGRVDNRLDSLADMIREGLAEVRADIRKIPEAVNRASVMSHSLKPRRRKAPIFSIASICNQGALELEYHLLILWRCARISSSPCSSNSGNQSSTRLAITSGTPAPWLPSERASSLMANGQ